MSKKCLLSDLLLILTQRRWNNGSGFIGIVSLSALIDDWKVIKDNTQLFLVNLTVWNLSPSQSVRLHSHFISSMTPDEYDANNFRVYWS